MQHILEIGESVEDFEIRQKPPFVTIPGSEDSRRLTEQQSKGIDGLFDAHPDDFKDCVLIHQYAEPLQVIDSFEMEETVWATLSRQDAQEQFSSGKNMTAEDVLVRPGAVYDSSTKGGTELHIGMQVIANFEGMSNPVQVVPVGPVARWSSKWRVPLAGFLCLQATKSDSAPVLFSLPTPCVPTVIDVEGNWLSPLLDKFEVFIGSTRVAFDSKMQAERFCLAYSEEIARDLATTVWDAEQLKFAMPDSQQIQDAAPAAQLSAGDVCYRFCEDNSQPPVNRRSLCPANAPCSSPLSPEIMSYDQCGPRAHTCGGVAENATAAAVMPAYQEMVAGGAPSPSVEAEPPAGLDNTGDEALNEAEEALAQPVANETTPVVEIGDEASMVQRKVAVVAAQRRHLAHRLRRRRQHRHHRHKTVLLQTVAGDALLRGHKHHHHRHPKTLAEARLWMKSGKRSTHVDVDVAERGQPSLAVIRNPDLLSFVTKSRHRGIAEGWTLGTKKLLVLVMDWQAGDDSLAPYSKQDVDPLPHYRDYIFPEVQKRFSEMSYGQFGLDITFVPEVVRYTKKRNRMDGRLPFPALYNEARESLQGHPVLGNTFAFRDYDLVFVIHPQVAPVGTKGVAWVGSRGAVCNGCETISDKFKIMVAVHELGHNLGLSHASSEALEYGNPFDWMGNYPDVVGLHYGLGYKAELHWVKDANIMDITDANVDSLNDMVKLTPFDTNDMPKPGHVVGVRISLRENKDDIYLSYRSTANELNRGLFIVYQSKDAPNSKLMDAACHSASQQDAHLREGWTFMDGSMKIIVKAVKEANEYVELHIYRAPASIKDISAIRARPGFTDGRTKCPMTCRDSDLIISRSCASLKQDGYCTGSMTLQGNKLSIGTEVCPETCGQCPKVLAENPELQSGGCEDKNVQISGMDCAKIAARELCSSKTTSGKKLGTDLCPRSCGECPKVPPPASSSANFPDPEPLRLRGNGGTGTITGVDACPDGCQAPTVQPGSAGNGGLALMGNLCTARASQRFGDIRYCGSGGAYEEMDSLDCSGCRSYVAELAGMRLSCPYTCMAPACTHGSNVNGGVQLVGDRCTARCSNSYGEQRFCGAGDLYEAPGSVDCSGCIGDGVAVALKDAEEDRQKAEEAIDTSAVCEDDEHWADVDGHGCESYRNTIALWGKDYVCKKHWGGQASLHCRSTCGTCKGDVVRASGCADNTCIGPWMEAYGRCFRCADYSRGCEDEDTRDVFHVECPLTCGVCSRGQDEAPSQVGTHGEGEGEDGDDGDIEVSRAADDSKHDKKEDKLARDCDDTAGFKQFCTALGSRYCSEQRFAKKCKRTCELCSPHGEAKPVCEDVFPAFTCARYESYGWCTREDTRDSVRLQCPATCGVCGEKQKLPTTPQAASPKNHGEQKAASKEAAQSGAIPARAVAYLLVCLFPIIVAIGLTFSRPR